MPLVESGGKRSLKKIIGPYHGGTGVKWIGGRKSRGPGSAGKVTKSVGRTGGPSACRPIGWERAKTNGPREHHAKKSQAEWEYRRLRTFRQMGQKKGEKEDIP